MTSPAGVGQAHHKKDTRWLQLLADTDCETAFTSRRRSHEEGHRNWLLTCTMKTTTPTPCFDRRPQLVASELGHRGSG